MLQETKSGQKSTLSWKTVSAWKNGPRALLPFLWTTSPLLGMLLNCLLGKQSSQQAQYIDAMFIWCWASVADAGPTSNQHWEMSCLLGEGQQRCLWKNFVILYRMGIWHLTKRACGQIAGEWKVDCYVFKARKERVLVLLLLICTSRFASLLRSRITLSRTSRSLSSCWHLLPECFSKGSRSIQSHAYLSSKLQDTDSNHLLCRRWCHFYRSVSFKRSAYTVWYMMAWLTGLTSFLLTELAHCFYFTAKVWPTAADHHCNNRFWLGAAVD